MEVPGIRNPSQVVECARVMVRIAALRLQVLAEELVGHVDDLALVKFLEESEFECPTCVTRYKPTEHAWNACNKRFLQG